jgi:hypothetical protein
MAERGPGTNGSPRFVDAVAIAARTHIAQANSDLAQGCQSMEQCLALRRSDPLSVVGRCGSRFLDEANRLQLPGHRCGDKRAARDQGAVTIALLSASEPTDVSQACLSLRSNCGSRQPRNVLRRCCVLRARVLPIS